MFDAFFRHWYVGAGVPEAVTLNEAGSPEHTVSGEGCPVMEAAVLTVSDAPLLGALPHEFVTTQS